MGRKPKSQAKGAGVPAVSPPPSGAPAPESVEFSVDSVKAQLKARYVRACEEAENPEHSGRDRATQATLAARLLREIGLLARAEIDAQVDQKLLEAAETLEELQTRGPRASGSIDDDPPFEAPETPAPN